MEKVTIVISIDKKQLYKVKIAHIFDYSNNRNNYRKNSKDY